MAKSVQDLSVPRPSGSGRAESPQVGNHPSDDVRRLLELLSKHVGCVPDAPPLLTADGSWLTAVTEAVERITVEHAGMAEELLAVYEQLGIVFELTRELPAVQSESKVIDLFVDCLQRSFEKRNVFVKTSKSQNVKIPPSDVSTFRRFDVLTFHDWLETMVHRARDRQGVLVDQPPSAFIRVAEVMVGPVFAGPPPEGFVCAIVLTRNHVGPTFQSVEPDPDAFHTSDMLLLESLTMFCGDLIRNHRLVQELREVSMAMVRSLVNAVDQKDQYTSGHSLRVGYFATLLGKAVGLEDADLQMLKWSALLHDVGKIGIRDAVLKKEGKLTDEEFNHVKEHPVRSHKVVQEVPQLARALHGVLHHHEHYDGTGYPAGLAGSAIPLQARIIQVADVFDALTSDRSYRPAYDWAEALDILKQEAGKAVDPHLQKVFDRLIHETVGDDPDGWANMLRRANQFTHIGVGSKG